MTIENKDKSFSVLIGFFYLNDYISKHYDINFFLLATFSNLICVSMLIIDVEYDERLLVLSMIIDFDMVM